MKRSLRCRYRAAAGFRRSFFQWCGGSTDSDAAWYNPWFCEIRAFLLLHAQDYGSAELRELLPGVEFERAIETMALGTAKVTAKLADLQQRLRDREV